jgi:hypothetical protein
MRVKVKFLNALDDAVEGVAVSDRIDERVSW